MALDLKDGQSCLEAQGIEERNTEVVRNDYNKTDEYGPSHPNAIADGDPLGKGTHDGYNTLVPDCSKGKTMIDYTNFNSHSEAGGSYDIQGRQGIGGRNASLVINKWGANKEYGANSVNSSENVNDGQYIMN
jgi:hypothetical protein